MTATTSYSAIKHVKKEMYACVFFPTPLWDNVAATAPILSFAVVISEVRTI